MATKTKERGPNRGDFRTYPPVDNCSPADWAWRTKSPVYRRTIKRSVQAVNAYLLLSNPRSRGVSGGQRDFCHFMLDPMTDERKGRRRERDTNETPKDSVKY